MQSDLIRKATEVLQGGGLVAFPTETVYGLGANAFESAAVEKIYSMKERPSANPLIVHIAEINQLKELVQKVEPMEQLLIAAFWPGPLTLVFPKSDKVPKIVSGGLKTVAVRMPAHPMALELIKSCGFPIAAPSANPSGKPSATSHEHVKAYFGDRIFRMEGGETQHGLESTVVQIKNKVPHIYRLGSVTPEDIERVTGVKPVIDTRSPHSPGTHFKHYSPETQLCVLNKEVWKTRIYQALEHGKRVGILATTESARSLRGFEVTVFDLGSESNLMQVGSRLYSGLIELDQQKLNIIFVQELPKTGLGLAIMDRLQRAASR
jgi:L-threonylcarbamoyladenylate synthase